MSGVPGRGARSYLGRTGVADAEDEALADGVGAALPVDFCSFFLTLRGEGELPSDREDREERSSSSSTAGAAATGGGGGFLWERFLD